MRYLKYFENSEGLTDKEIAKLSVPEIENILLDIKDDDYPLDIAISMDYEAHIFITITNYQNKPISWSDIKPYLYHIQDEIKDFAIDIIYYKQEINGKIYNKRERETLSWIKFKNRMKDEDKFVFLALELVQIK